MAKIKPVISKKNKRNVYDYFDPELNTTVKVCGFDIYLYDRISQQRIRKRIKADYKTVKLYVENLLKDMQNITSFTSNSQALPHMTLKKFLKKFNADKSQKSDRVGKGLKKETIRRYETAINSIIEFNNDDILLSKLTENFIERWLFNRRSNGLSVNTLNSYLRHFKSLFNWGIKKRIINSNPFQEIPVYKSVQKPIRVLSEKEIEGILKICKPNSRWHPYILVYLLTGARISEILKPKLKWEDVDFENNVLHLNKRKRGKQTAIPLTKSLKNVFMMVKEAKNDKMSFRQKDDNEFVFPYSPSYVSRKLKSEVFIPAGLPEVSVHDLRRSFASHLAHLGFELYDVSQLMAHSKTDVTQAHYLSQLPSKSKKMLEKLENYLGFTD